MPMTPPDIILMLRLKLYWQFFIKKNLSTLSTWFEQNLLWINNTKSQAMIFGASTYKYDLYIYS